MTQHNSFYTQGVGGYSDFSAGPFVDTSYTNYADSSGSSYMPPLGGMGNVILPTAAEIAQQKAATDAQLVSDKQRIWNDRASQDSVLRVPTWLKALGWVGFFGGLYHGYKRNDSIGWGIGWALFGGAIPVLAIPIALIQGLGKQKYKTVMVPNKRKGVALKRRLARKTVG